MCRSYLFTLTWYDVFTGTIYAYSSRLLYVDSHPLPYAVNQTISYPSDGRRMPYLVQRLRAEDINVERSISDDSVRYNLTTAIGKGKCRFIHCTVSNKHNQSVSQSSLSVSNAHRKTVHVVSCTAEPLQQVIDRKRKKSKNIKT